MPRLNLAEFMEDIPEFSATNSSYLRHPSRGEELVRGVLSDCWKNQLSGETGDFFTVV